MSTFKKYNGAGDLASNLMVALFTCCLSKVVVPIYSTLDRTRTDIPATAGNSDARSGRRPLTCGRRGGRATCGRPRARK